MSKLSVVLPAYNEELMVGKTCRVLAQILTEAKIPYELVVVNDGSSDRTWEEIQKAGEKDSNVTGGLFSRNFGKILDNIYIYNGLCKRREARVLHIFYCGGMDYARYSRY